VRSPYTLPTSTNATNTWCVLMLVGVGSESHESFDSVTGVATVFVVDCRFFHLWLKWPFTVAIYLGRCLRTKSSVSPGQVAKCPARIDFSHVSGTGTGLKAASCRNLTRSRLLLHSYTLCASLEFNVARVATPTCMLVFFSFLPLGDGYELLSCKSTVHNPFRKSRCPSNFLPGCAKRELLSCQK
jgi:hypothetical protein